MGESDESALGWQAGAFCGHRYPDHRHRRCDGRRLGRRGSSQPPFGGARPPRQHRRGPAVKPPGGARSRERARNPVRNGRLLPGGDARRGRVLDADRAHRGPRDRRGWLGDRGLVPARQRRRLGGELHHHLVVRPATHRQRAQPLDDRGRPDRRHQLHLHGHRQHRRRAGQPRRHVGPGDPGSAATAAPGAARPAAAGQLRPVLDVHRRPARLHHRRGVRPVAHPFPVAVARRPAEDEGRRVQRGHRLLRLGLLLPGARRLRLHRGQGHEPVPEHGTAGGPVRDRQARPLHQRRDRRGRDRGLGAAVTRRLPHRRQAVRVRGTAVALGDRLDHRPAPDHRRRGRDRLPDRERVHRAQRRRPAVPGQPGTAGALRRDQRPVHVQPVLRRPVLHQRDRSGEHQRA